MVNTRSRMCVKRARHGSTSASLGRMRRFLRGRERCVREEQRYAHTHTHTHTHKHTHTQHTAHTCILEQSAKCLHGDGEAALWDLGCGEEGPECLDKCNVFGAGKRKLVDLEVPVRRARV